MRSPKWNRRQKLVRNLLIIALCLFLMAWQQGFPVHSHQALLQRAAGAYLIDESVELLYVDEEEACAYGAVDGKLFRVNYTDSFFGMKPRYDHLYTGGQRYLPMYQTHGFLQSNQTSFFLQFEADLIGFLGEAATAEMDVTLTFQDAATHEVTLEEIRTLTGTREGESHLRFSRLESTWEGVYISALPAAVRLYDEKGTLLEETIYTLDDLLREDYRI